MLVLCRYSLQTKLDRQYALIFILQQAMYLCEVLCKITAREQFCLVYIRITCSIWYFIQFIPFAIFMSLHVPAGACIPVASASPIHVFPIQRVLKHCGAHKHYIYDNLQATTKENERLDHLRSHAYLGCKNLKYRLYICFMLDSKSHFVGYYTAI